MAAKTAGIDMKQSYGTVTLWIVIAAAYIHVAFAAELLFTFIQSRHTLIIVY